MKTNSKQMKEKDVAKSPDSRIDQDFPGFPHAPANKKSIVPETAQEKKLAGATRKKSKKVYGGPHP